MDERAKRSVEVKGDAAGGAGGEDSPHRLEQQRRENRAAIAALDVAPYGVREEGLASLARVREMYDGAADEAYQRAVEAAKAGGTVGREGEIEDARARVKVAGRVVLKRDGGKLIWMQLRDHTTGPVRSEDEGEGPGGAGGVGGADADGSEGDGGGAWGWAADLQVAVSKKDCAAPGFEVAKKLDLGDVVVVEGPVMKTRAGEVTVWASALRMGTKSLAPPPEKWSGLQDVELRYRRRYVDLYANPETMRTAKLRSRLVGRIRAYLDARGDFEVETPVLQTLAGGAAARPFKTHMNALDIDLFMRIAPELYHKRLIVGGMPGVYELSRNFRNEGLDKSHNPEFTSLEVYEAFGDYLSMLDLTEGLVRACARFVVAEKMGRAEGEVRDEELRLPFGELEIDYGRPFERVTYAQLFERGLGFSMVDVERARAEAAKRGLKTKNEKGVALDDAWVVNELFEEVAEHAMDPARPTFVLDYPSALSPLTRPHADRPELAQRWDLFAGGMELGPAYTELNDPDVQAAKFREQLAGIDDEESTFRTFDEDFVQALKVVMPPAGGMGLGIDRLCMLLLNQRSIRDVILFPMMRPEG